LVVALGLSGGGYRLSAQHIHINAGAVSQTQNSPLRFANSAVYNTNSNVGGSSPPTPACFFMDNTDPLYPDLYSVEVSLTALPATLWTGGPAPGAAAQGAFLEVKVHSVSGPTGGEISFWEENEEATESVRRFAIPVGTSNATNRFNISEGFDTPSGPDPFGHIHGRRFTANRSGLYVVGLQVVDTSTAGLGGGPIHQPSALTNFFYFQAGVYLNSMLKTNKTVTVQYGARSFHNYFLQGTTNLADAGNWFTIATNITTIGPDGAHSDLHYLSDTNAIGAARFYRLLEIAQ
jgi:hypothetical protein